MLLLLLVDFSYGRLEENREQESIERIFKTISNVGKKFEESMQRR